MDYLELEALCRRAWEGDIEARKKLEEAAREGDYYAPSFLTGANWLDVDTRIYWGKKGAEQDLSCAIDVGDLYKDFKQDYEQAMFWYKKVIAESELEGQVRRAQFHLQELEEKIAEKEAGDRLKTEAENGKPEAQFDYGNIFNLEENYAEAFKWFSKAAEHGEPRAQTELAVIYYDGLGGVKQDRQKAVKLWNMALSQGRERAQQLLDLVFDKHGASDLEIDPDNIIYVTQLKKQIKRNLIRVLNILRGRSISVRGIVESLDQYDGYVRVRLGSMHSPCVDFFFSKNDPLLAELNAGEYATINAQIRSDADAMDFRLDRCEILRTN